MDHGSRTRLLVVAVALSAAPFAACSLSAPPASNAPATNAPASAPAAQSLTTVERPQKIKDMMAQRGEQDAASPSLEFAEPKEGATIKGSTVAVKLNLGGDLKGYHPMKDPSTGMGNHIHVILDNQPYEAYYDLAQPFELRNVSAGKHTLRVFASRPWHESYKNEAAFKMVTFTVEGGGDASKPTTTGSGQVMADNKNAAPAAANKNATEAANKNAAPTREGKDMQASTAGEVDAKKPLLTYSRPKGEYKGDDTNAIMIDFWLSNAKLTGDGGEYKVRYSVDGGEAKTLEKWEPIWLSGWTAGKHTIKLELVDKDGKPVDNGGYNATPREITVVK
jgi:hypothetical protein